MASRNSSSRPSSSPEASMGSASSRGRETSQRGRPTSAQKLRSEGEHEKARAPGGGLRSQPAEKPAGPSASTGGRATASLARSSMNSRSSNSGRQRNEGASAASASRGRTGSGRNSKEK